MSGPYDWSFEEAASDGFGGTRRLTELVKESVTDLLADHERQTRQAVAALDRAYEEIHELREENERLQNQVWEWKDARSVGGSE